MVHVHAKPSDTPNTLLQAQRSVSAPRARPASAVAKRGTTRDGGRGAAAAAAGALARSARDGGRVTAAMAGALAEGKPQRLRRRARAGSGSPQVEAAAEETVGTPIPEDDPELRELSPMHVLNWGRGTSCAWRRAERHRARLMAKPEGELTAEELEWLLWAEDDDGPPLVRRFQEAPQLTEEVCVDAEKAAAAWRAGKQPERTLLQAIRPKQPSYACLQPVPAHIPRYTHNIGFTGPHHVLSHREQIPRAEGQPTACADHVHPIRQHAVGGAAPEP